MNDKKSKTIGWGVSEESQSEFWDARPIFVGKKITLKDKVKLIFFPKKFLLYKWIKKKIKNNNKIKILDVGCGTGASVIEMKKMWGDKVEIIGVDVIQMQIDLAKERAKEYGVDVNFLNYDGNKLPFESNYFDVVYSSDVLGHVKNVETWLKELNRVLKNNGLLAMFSESKLGKHAWIRKYLLKNGLNIDPHKEFHISLYSKDNLIKLLSNSGFVIKKMYSVFWLKFLAHPDEFYGALQNQNKFPILKFLNKIFFWIKKKTHPFSTAFWELYGLIEMVTIGKLIESQGYVILSIKE